MGYFRDQKGIMNRYLRESENWKKHLRYTREFIMESAENKNKYHAIVLGSGWLLDVPLEELSQQFKQVTLTDILHPPQIKKKAEKFPNVTLWETDLTGGMINNAYKQAKAFKKSKELPVFREKEKITLPQEPDFIISCNTLTQLGILIKEYLKKYPGIPEKSISELEETTQRNHLELLIPGKSCLITEYEEEIYNEEDQLIGTNPLLKVKLPAGKKQAQWKWHFDTRMYYREDAKTFMNVKAVDW